MIRPDVLRGASLSLAAMALCGCFATQNDVRVLQGDIALVRNEAAAADSARRVQLDHILAMLRETHDSLALIDNRLMHFRSDASTSMSSMEQEMLQVQELVGQSQQKLQEMRASLEARQPVAPPPPPPTGTTAGAGPQQDATPGPNQLFRVANQLLQQGSNAAARTAFQDLLSRYPTSDLAPEAQFDVAETYALEGNVHAADSVYEEVARTYPKSPRAATSLYKRGVLAQSAGNTAEARRLFEAVVKQYPKTDEAVLAQDRIKALH